MQYALMIYADPGLEESLSAADRAAASAEDLVLLEDQDRSLWDMAKVASGRAALDRAVALGGRGAYVLRDFPEYKELVQGIEPWRAEPASADLMTVLGSYHLF